MVRRAITKGQRIYWYYCRMNKNNTTTIKEKRVMTQKQLEQWQQDLERDTKHLSFVMMGGIIGGCAMVAALGIWVYLAFTV